MSGAGGAVVQVVVVHMNERRFCPAEALVNRNGPSRKDEMVCCCGLKGN